MKSAALAFQLPVDFLIEGLLLVLNCMIVIKLVRTTIPDKSLIVVKLEASIHSSPKASRLMIEFAANAMRARVVVKMPFITSRIVLLADRDSSVVFGSFFHGHGGNFDVTR